MGILTGLRIVEVSAFVAVPVGTMTLAQLGAEVVRVDPLGGGLDAKRWPVAEDGTSLYWAGLNKGKRSVTIDVSTPEGQGLVRALIRDPAPSGGIVVTNVSPKWLDYEELRAERPDLIFVQLVGNSDSSAAVDYTVNAATGLPLITGERGIVNHVLPAWDLLAGATLAMAILAAERWRRETGLGNFVRLSLADLAFTSVGHLGYAAEVAHTGETRERYGNFVYGSFGKDFKTQDGESVMIVALTPRQWRAVVQAAGLSEYVREKEEELGVSFEDESVRFKHRDWIVSLVQDWSGSHTLAEISDQLDASGVCWERYQTVAELFTQDWRTDPARNPIWREIEQGSIVHRSPGSPVEFAGADRIAASPAPELGADTRDVLASILGLDDGELDRLAASGII